ncbi:MAG TPA: hypothetical protein VG474_10835 [Solirubrobacteraceae bacterium]|nr:hypothetical protein [Solirubrobacteraceae bacterium]
MRDGSHGHNLRMHSGVLLAAFVGLLVGLGLGLASNVSGVVLGFYGLILGALLAGAASLARRGRRS